MDRIIYFGLSESSSTHRLVTSYNKPDNENGEGKYLGLIKINDRDYLVTLALTGHNKGFIMVNEVLFDCYMDGDITFYYNSNKSRNCRRLEAKLNNPTILCLLKNEGEDIRTVLKRVEEVKSSSLQNAFESEFHPSERIIYPEGFDIRKLSLNDLEKVGVETMTVLGINEEVFDTLYDVINKHPSSFYSLARNYDDLQREHERLIQENERLKRELEKKDGNFHK